MNANVEPLELPEETQSSRSKRYSLSILRKSRMSTNVLIIGVIAFVIMAGQLWINHERRKFHAKCDEGDELTDKLCKAISKCSDKKLDLIMGR